MGKKILVAVGDCVYSQQSVKYVARTSSAAKDLKYTLFNVQLPVPKMFIAGAKVDPKVRSEVNKLVRKNAENAESVVGALKDLMVEEGISESRIEVVAAPLKAGMAKDILGRAEQGAYNAIVLARRGLTPSPDFFIGTTAAKVMEHALKMPVWIVGGEATSMDMLIAVDGSESSLRQLRHLVNMVGSSRQLRLTLFHVIPFLRHYYSLDFERQNPALQAVVQQEDNKRMEDFYGRSETMLTEAGFKKSQIKIKTNTGSHDVSTAILDEARSQEYDTVVIGRRGEREAVFTGRIAMRLVQKISRPALWVVA
ncbi:MAG: universal stress protein [Thermodesulfobacteriota bacterium]|nr:universal stress protein [Thermodesulfobacteriota bacterium]